VLAEETVVAPPELPKQEETIKVATWNINGLRAALKKGTLEAFLRQAFPDILALSERSRATQAWAYSPEWHPVRCGKAGNVATAFLLPQTKRPES